MNCGVHGLISTRADSTQGFTLKPHQGHFQVLQLLSLRLILFFLSQVLHQEVGKLASGLEQLVVGALLRDPPVLHHHDLVHLGQELDAENRAEVVAQRQKLMTLDQQIVGLILAPCARD